MIRIDGKEMIAEGEAIDIEIESQICVLTILDILRDNISTEYALEYASNLGNLMKNYVEAMSQGKSHEECMKYAIERV